MNKNEFYMVLPSNSSMHYYADNTASRYTTLLPKQIDLPGEWVVGLSEIQFPYNFLHIREEVDSEVLLSFSHPSSKKRKESEKDLAEKASEFVAVHIPSSTVLLGAAVFQTISDLIVHLNNTELQWHFKFEYNPITGFVKLSRKCQETVTKICKNHVHHLKLSDKLWTILGFATGSHAFPVNFNTIIGDRPASLSRGLPESLYIYCDLCVPYITGDVQSSLLRVIPVNTGNYTYGTTHCVTLTSPHYIPLIRSCIRTVEMDIRNNRGELIPFAYGPLTVTLHFKRID